MCRRLLHAQTLTVNFKKHWYLLAETNVAVLRTAKISEQFSEWWSLLDKVRTFFEENGDV